MRRRCLLTKQNRVITAFVGLCAIIAIPVNAQPTADSHHARTLAYDRTHEITVNATVEQVITKPAAGSPAGLHVMVTGPDGTVDAHLGPYMTQETREALRVGTPVQIVGAMDTVSGKSYLLARQLIFGGRLVTVRSLGGFLIQGSSSHAHRGAQKTSAFKSDGGAR